MLTLSRRDLAHIAEITASGTRALAAAVARAADALTIAEPMDRADWINEHIEMSAEMTDRPGKFILDPVQASLVREGTEPDVKRGALGKVPRMGMTTVWCAVMLYYACHEGIDVIYTERTDEAAQTFYKGVLLPMIVGSPKIAHLRREVRDGARQDTWRDTYLTNGAKIQIRSVTGDGFARQIKSGFSFADEAGSKEYQSGRAGSEGDKISLLEKRGQQFRHPHMILSSTPTEKATCVITREHLAGDQRVWDMPCPHCGVFQPFLPRVGNKPGPGLKFGLDPVSGKLATYDLPRRPDGTPGGTVPDVWYECADCEGQIRETEKVTMIAKGHFRPTADPQKPGYRSWHVWAAHSTDPQSTWAHIVEDYLASLADPTLRQTFHNLRLALPWEHKTQRAVPISELEARAEAYQSTCPQGVKLITWGMDCQKGTEDGRKPARGEMVVLGWGYQYECWVLAHYVIEHIPFGSTWGAEVYKLHDQPWTRPDGTVLRAFSGAVDCSYNWDEGLTFCHMPESASRGIRAIQGKNTKIAEPTVADTSKRPDKLWAWIRINKQTATNALDANLRLFMAGPGRIHTPRSLEQDFYVGLTAYKRVSDKKGNSWWEKREGSEIYDCWCYGYALIRQVMIERKQLRPFILHPPLVDDVKSGAGSAKPYDGPDRSANSALGVEAALAEPTPTVSRAPVASAYAPDPAPSRLPIVGQTWGQAPGARPAPAPRAGPKQWGRL